MKSAREKDPVKLLIFKDGEISRSIEVSENWLIKIGLLLLSLTAVSALSAAFAFRIYWQSRPLLVPTPTASVLAEAPASPPAAPASPPAAPVPSPVTIPTAQASAVSTKTPIVTAPTLAAPSPIAAGSASAPAQSNLSAVTTLSEWVAQLPTSSQVSESNRLDIAALEAAWSGRSIGIRFNIQTLTAESSGARQGRFVVLVYGASGVLAYPPEVLEGSQLNLRRGETYSVARFRSVKLTVNQRPGMKETAELRAEVLLLDRDLNLIVKKSTEVTGRPMPPPLAPPSQKPAPSPSAAVTPES